MKSQAIGRLTLVVAVAAFAGLAGCKKKEATTPPPTPTQAPDPARAPNVRVTEVQLGNALGEDKRVKAPTTSFAKKDTVFAAVVTEGAAPSAELTARWTYQDGQLVNESKRAITPGAVSVTEFSIQKPDGWPAGDYKVEISLDGKPVQSKAFKIQ
jgi:hypothetical protein